ncbi:MAG: glycosyltransferase family 2 protein [Anaerolineales bacterium]|nr:glycosyltransferase family 2 protein [Anaerolineales bacterium]
MLTAIVLTLNEEKHLPDCLASLSWADEVIVFDSFSSDRTVGIARAAGARVVQRRFDDYAGQRNAALQATDAEWVFFVDADERVTPELAAEVRSVLNRAEAGWWVPRHNYIFGVLTRHAGWYPDYQLRLLRRNRARYDPNRPVHELVLLDGRAGYLQQPLIHLNYDTVAEFIAKQTAYARYDAERLRLEGVRARPHHLLTMPMRQFWWRFVTLAGWRDGWHGLRLSALMARFEFEKHRMLQERVRGDEVESRE